MNREPHQFFQEKFFLMDKLPFVNRQWFGACTAVLAGVLVLIFSFQSGPKASLFAQAENLFAKWEASPQDEILYQKMTQAMRKAPPLQKKYEAVIAQKLIGGGKGVEALQMACRALELARGEAPFHAAFAETSLLIEQEKYQTALQQAVALRERMTKECDIKKFLGDRLVGGSFLYVYNLLRIACLQQELKNHSGERAAWEELGGFLNNERSPVIHLVLSSFQEKGVDLFHYINSRISVLH